MCVFGCHWVGGSPTSAKQEKKKKDHKDLNKEGTGLCNACEDKEKKQFKCKKQDCNKWQLKRGADDPEKSSVTAATSKMGPNYK